MGDGTSILGATLSSSPTASSHSPCSTPDSPRSVVSIGTSSFSNGLEGVGGSSLFGKERDHGSASTASSDSELGCGSARNSSPESLSSLASGMASGTANISQLGLGASCPSHQIVSNNTSVSQLDLGAILSSSPTASGKGVTLFSSAKA